MVLLHADADAFLASVAQRGGPSLPGRAMVVAHEILVRFNDGAQVLERGTLESPAVDPALLRAAAGHLLEPTAYESDERVTMLGLTLRLPAPA